MTKFVRPKQALSQEKAYIFLNSQFFAEMYLNLTSNFSLGIFLKLSALRTLEDFATRVDN